MKVIFSTIILCLTQYFVLAQCVAPVIQSVEPIQGEIGSEVDIYGTNLISSSGTVQVLFGATMAAVNLLSSTSTHLKVTVPSGAGYAPLTVKNACGLIGVSKLSFNVLFCQTTLNANSFNTLSHSQSVSGGYQLLSKDLDLDGKPDLIICGFTTNKISLCRNTGSQTIISFAPKVDFTFSHPTRCVVPADYNGDGKIDLAVVIDNAAAGIIFYRNTSSAGNISFAAPTAITGIKAYQCASADFNNDGKVDLVVSQGEFTSQSEILKTYRNTSIIGGAISFSENTSISNLGFATGLVTVDLDNDGKQDIASSCGMKNYATIIRNITVPFSAIFKFCFVDTFATRDSEATDYPYRLLTGDFNSDGKMDLATNNYDGTSAIAILRNITRGNNISFASPQLFAAENGNYRLDINDVNGDGKPDIVTRSNAFNYFSIFENNTTSNTTILFKPKIDYPTNAEVGGLIMTDLDGDAMPDIALSGTDDNLLRVYKNLSPPSISSCNEVENVTACTNYTWLKNRMTYSTSGTYTTTIVQGTCVCVKTLNLTIQQGTNTIMNDSACYEYNWACACEPLRVSGTYYCLSPTSCDTTTLNLTITNPPSNTYCSSGASYSGDEEIINFSIGMASTNACYSNANACVVEAPGPGSILKKYSNFKTLGSLTTLIPGQSYNFTINANECDGSPYFSFGAAIWIDYNCDGVFSDFTEKVFVESNALIGPRVISGTITIPLTVACCRTALRVTIAEGYSGAGLTSCLPYSYGETEDYLIDIGLPTNYLTEVSSCAFYWPCNGQTYTAAGTYTCTRMQNCCVETNELSLSFSTCISVNVHAYLSAPFVTASGMMHDSLRTANLIPNVEPYSMGPYSKPIINDPAGEVVPAAVLAVTGANAIVDWVFLELREASNSANIVATKRALIQRDGDVVNCIDGLSPVPFYNLCSDNYYVCLKHRNHLGLMTANSVPLSGLPLTIDFASPSTPVYTIVCFPCILNAPRKLIGNVALLWGGDANTNKNVKYNGNSNDKEAILNAVGLNTPNITVVGYRQEDLNMDGKVRFSNTDNDKNFILNFVIGVSTPNKIFYQHTPN